jgi:hypothetical protein
MHRSSFALVSFLLLLASDVPLPAQYPPGGGIPMPRRGKKKTTTKQDNNQEFQNVAGILRYLDAKAVVVEAQDTRIISLVRSSSTKFLKDGNDIKPDILKPGDHLLIEANEDEQGYLYAVNVMLQKEGTAEERAAASQPIQLPMEVPRDDDERPVQRRRDSPADAGSKKPPAPGKGPQDAQAKTSAPGPDTPPAGTPETPPAAAQDDLDLTHIPASTSARTRIDESDSGPPLVKRGKPAPRKSSPAEEVAVNSPPAAASESPNGTIPVPSADTDIDVKPSPVGEAPPPPDPRIEKARAAAATFSESLPNYVCKEQMARFASATHIVDWRPIDIVSADVVYDKHREEYRNLAINGKPAKKDKMEEIGGARSTGEFGTLLEDLFSPGTAADFRYRRASKSGGRDAFLYDFDVIQEHSHWTIHAPSQSVSPAYKGSVWIDKETSRVLRIEMEAYHLPEAFPFDKAESAVDYEFIRIGEGQFLLPVHAEVMSCQRGTNMCTRNLIDFRNYHKYSGESTIIFGK